MPVVWSAKRDFQNQNYEIAIAKYDNLAANHPDVKSRQLYLMQKGRSLYLIRCYHDAQETFRRYTLEYPDGIYTAEAEAYLTKIEALRAEKERRHILQHEQIRGDVKQLRQLLTNDPYNARIHYELANKLWELGEYNQAARHYLKAGEIDAALKESELINNRLMIGENGKVVPITPRRQRVLERERNPLIIFDVHNYKQRIKPDYFGARQAFETVAGKVRNQSKRVLHNVSVSVNFYNIHHELLDTQTFYVGTMGPREVRAFLVKGQNYDNLYNIDHFECSPTFQ